MSSTASTARMRRLLDPSSWSPRWTTLVATYVILSSRIWNSWKASCTRQRDSYYTSLSLSFSLFFSHCLSIHISLSQVFNRHTLSVVFNSPYRSPPALLYGRCAHSPVWHTRAPVCPHGAGSSPPVPQGPRCCAGRHPAGLEDRTAPPHTCSEDLYQSWGRSGTASRCTCPEQTSPDRERGCVCVCCGFYFRVLPGQILALFQTPL